MSSIDTTAHVEDAEQIGCVDIGLQLSSGLFIPGDILSCIAWYLTINKAAMAMTVCQAFHHHLARRVWRDVSYVDGKLHNRFVPDSAWLRYGHLVRSLAIPSAPASDVVSQLMPNVATVSINLNNIDVDFFDEDPLEGLDNLRHVRIETGRADADVATAAIHWVARSEWSRNIDSVTWDVVYYWYPEELDVLRLLLRESEYNPQRTLIEIQGYLEELNAVQIGPFMPHFTSISLHASYMARCPSMISPSFLRILVSTFHGSARCILFCAVQIQLVVILCRISHQKCCQC
ncbi:hypothetical protein GQ42DRAFT_77843 [Ramicandelaber brevisporus]|nr:hypothetical protein GQ42DRAFT_77843 [Ramicandelaber brevisporus]